ncbi:MAG: LysM peptidoglycan-binding domain-containing protein [Gallionellaceae bacterium]
MTTYTVKQGDTLGSIANQFYGDSSRYKEIAAANGIQNPNIIHVGQIITIPNLDELEVSEPAPVEAHPTGFKLTAPLLQKIMPTARQSDINKYLEPLNAQLPKFEINTPLRLCHFIAQIAHESGNFRYDSEDLNYSASGLQTTFHKYFPSQELAKQYEKQPEKIANRVYASRMGNGDEASGDGWKYRGRGLIQLTGCNNYTKCGQSIGLDLVNNPEPLAKDPAVAVQGAGWYWQANNLNILADRDDVRAVTKAINGGYNGLADREAILARAKSVLM